MSAVDAVRYIGTLIELVGLILVGWGILETAHRFDRIPDLRTMVRRALSWRPFHKPQNVTVQTATAEAKVTSGGRVAARIEAGKHQPPEARIAALEKRMNQVEEQNNALVAQVRRESEERQAADERERQSREQTDENVRKLVRQQAAGALGREAVGVGCFAFGLLLTNLSEEIARWLPW